jgi:triacylglycerol lipase
MHERMQAVASVAELPVLVVHGIWDSAARIAPLVRGLRARGVRDVVSFDLQPSDGRVPMRVLSAQVREHVERLQREHGVQRIDVVGFSMGALATRYFVQRDGGRECVRRFVSIAGPHAGTYTAYALPFVGVREMRPGSPLLVDLAADVDPWGAVEVHCLYTPFDLTIMPATSGILRGARTTTRVPVAIHRLMMGDARVLDRVVALLRAP